MKTLSPAEPPPEKQVRRHFVILPAIDAGRVRLNWGRWIAAAACLLALHEVATHGNSTDSHSGTSSKTQNVPPLDIPHEQTQHWPVAFGKEWWRQPLESKAHEVFHGEVARAAVNAGDVIDRVSHALSITAGNAPSVVSAETYAASFDDQGLSFMLVAPEQTRLSVAARFRTRSIGRDSHSFYSKNDSRPAWRVVGNTAQTLLNAQLRIIEHYETRREGVAVTWVLGRPLPGTGSLVVEADLDGMIHAGQSSQGHQFADRAGSARLRFGKVTAVDSAGRQWNIPVPAPADGVIRVEVSAEILSQATYPLAIDPLLSPEFEVGGTCLPSPTDWRRFGRLARNGDTRAGFFSKQSR